MARVNGAGYCLPSDVQDELAPESWEKMTSKYPAKVPGWISKFSDLVDDKIRSKYDTPFPDAPNGPATLRLAVTFYVVHMVYVFNGKYRGSEQDDQESYWAQAERIVAGIVSGDTQLETSYTDPDGNPVTVEVTNRPRYVSEGTNPMSLAAQEAEFGPAVRNRNLDGFRARDRR